MNIKNLRCYGKFFALTLATTITLTGCKQEENINFKEIRTKIEQTSDEDFSYSSLTSIKIKYDDIENEYQLSGKQEEIDVAASTNNQDHIKELLESATNLDSITIDSIKLEDIKLLNNISNKEKIKRISISSNHSLENINFLSDFKNLENLFLSISSNDYNAINQLKNLKSLGLYECIGDNIHLPALNLKELETLYIFPKEDKEYNTNFINSIQNSKNLETLAFRKVLLDNIDFLKGHTNLRYLDLGNTNISDISVIKDLVNLEYLYLDNNLIFDATPLYNLDNLEYIQINNNYLLEQISNKLEEKGILVMDENNNTFNYKQKVLIKGEY